MLVGPKKELGTITLNRGQCCLGGTECPISRDREAETGQVRRICSGLGALTQHHGGREKSSQRKLLVTSQGLETRLGRLQAMGCSRKMGTLPWAGTSEDSGLSACVAGPISGPYLEKGAKRCSDPNNTSSPPPRLNHPLSYHYGNWEFPSRVPIATDPVSMGTLHFPISSSVAITTPRITSFSSNPRLCANLPITSVPPSSVTLATEAGRNQLPLWSMKGTKYTEGESTSPLPISRR